MPCLRLAMLSVLKYFDELFSLYPWIHSVRCLLLQLGLRNLQLFQSEHLSELRLWVFLVRRHLFCVRLQVPNLRGHRS